MEGKKTPTSKRKTEDANAATKQAEDPFYSLKYKYTSFDDLKEQGEYCFYGIIYDANFPKEEENFAILPGTKEPLPKYSCILKLIDQTTNCLTNPTNFNENVITLVIQSNERENIPYVHQIGDIIRVHRGLYAPKNKRNVYLNLLKGNQFKGSWCIFSAIPDKEPEKPYLCSHKKYTYESQDKKIIESIRNWIKNYFVLDNSLVYYNQNTLANRITEGSDKDLIVHVVKKVELDDQLVFFIQDATDGCELHTYKYYDFIKENDVIRIRSYKVFDSDVLVLNEFGNILKIPIYSNCYKVFMNGLSKKLKDYQKK
jgi:hypothetical protein